MSGKEAQNSGISQPVVRGRRWATRAKTSFRLSMAAKGEWQHQGTTGWAGFPFRPGPGRMENPAYELIPGRNQSNVSSLPVRSEEDTPGWPSSGLGLTPGRVLYYSAWLARG
jgi:hypothetical protein